MAPVRDPITPPSLSCPSVKNVSLGSAPVRSRSPPRFRLRPDAGLPANGRRARAPPPGTILSRHHASTLGLLYMVFSRDASAYTPSPRRPARRRSQPRGSAHVTSAPGAFGPVGRRATGTRAATLSKPLFAAMSYVGACAHPNWRTRINNTEHKRRRAHYQSIEASFFA